MRSARVIVDTNVLISYLLLKHSPTGQAVSRVFAEAQPLASEATLTELADVLARSKFDAYIDPHSRQDFFRLYARIAEIVPITVTVRACRNPRDDKFLELAASGEAALIVTGDQDLLSMSRYGTVNFITPVQFLALPASALTAGTDDPS